VTEEAAGEILSLPMFPHLTAEQVTRVCEQLQEIVAAVVDTDVA
jgi:dTDP-4-amino-4,6-dideoxygalactose transaminase